MMLFTPSPAARRSRLLAPLALVLLALGGCSVQGLARKSLSGVFDGISTAFSQESDPELAGEALPFVLKLIEGLLVDAPDDPDLLLSASRGFTLYAYGFVELEAERRESESWRAARAERRRAVALYLRARDYGLRALENRYPGLGEELFRRPADAAARIEAESIDLLYWTAAPWGALVSAGKAQPIYLAQLPTVKALLRRVLELDEGYGDGAIHEAWIALESVSPLLGGSPQRAREHFERAVELSGGQSVSAYLALAEGVAVSSQDRGLFDDLLDRARSVDLDAAPDRRLQNTLALRRAELLAGRVDDLFLDEETP